MFIFYFLFFWILSSSTSFLAGNLQESTFLIFNEFFFCLDSFSTTFVIFYIVLFFIINDAALIKFTETKIRKPSYTYIKARFFVFVLKRFVSTISIFMWLKLKLYTNFIVSICYKHLCLLIKLLLSNRIIWRPLLKRWSYFGIWSKQNNRN